MSVALDFDVEQEYRENYRYADEYWAPYIQDTKVYTLAASGLTWSDQERRQLIQEGREPIEFNIMRRPISFFSGWLRDNLNSIIYSPVEGSDEKTADQLTEVGYYVWDKGKGYSTFLDGYDEAYKSGISLCGIQKDFTKDFISGDLKFYYRTFNSFYLDPTFSQIDLSDCGFAITRDLVGLEEAKQLLPFIDPKTIEDLAIGFRDDKFRSFRPNFTTTNRAKHLLTYDQYYRRTSRKRKFLVDMESHFFRDITDLPKEELDRLKFGIDRFRKTRENAEVLEINENDIPNIEIRDIDRTFIELHILLNGRLVYSGEDKTQITETYPFVPCLCYFEPSIFNPSQRIQGMAAAQWSNQRQFNKRHMKIIQMMDSTISTGYKYLIGSVPDPTDLQQSGSNRLIGIDPENAPAGLDSVQELQGGGANPTLIQYQDVLDKLSLTLGNVTPAAMGTDEKQNTLVSGRLAQVQIAQNLLTNRKVFDNVDASQQVLGSLVLKAIQRNYPPEKIRRILDEEPTEQFYESQFEQYDAVIKEGVRSKSQKDAYYFELIALKRDGIVDVPQEEIVRALQISGISDLKEAIEKQQEKEAEQQQKIDEQERLALELINSQKEQNLALAQERRARVLSDIGLAEERASESEENRAQAALARARTITEIASMQEDRILKVLEFVNQLELEEKADREQIDQRIQATANQINSETEGSEENKRVAQAAQQLEQPNQGV